MVEADAVKAQEVCAAAAAAFASCAHRRRRSPRRTHFVDCSSATWWHARAQIGEAASEDAVRRRYRQLALQLHPDKNRHPKAEVAFKIVSEAQACLTDKARRRAFDLERRGSFCAACHDRHAARWSKPPPDRARHQAPAATARSKALREVQNRMRDECRVIDGCLRANDASEVVQRRCRVACLPDQDGAAGVH